MNKDSHLASFIEEIKMNEISSNILETRGNPPHILTVLPPPPASKGRSFSLSSKHSSLVIESSEASQPPSQPTSLILPLSVKTNDSPGSSPTDTASSPRSSFMSSDSRSWAFLHKDGASSFEEHHHLLGNDEENSERHSSDEDFDIWTITEEQKEYYINQFKSMQPDLKKKISGATAKEFFEKSKLALTELSKIWRLSDVDKDGELGIEEFCTAMHLVVLRRNSIELPTVLPPSLVPKIPTSSKGKDPQTSSMIDVQPNKISGDAIPNHAPQSHVGGSPTKQPSPTELVSPQSKEWTKFNDSPTSSLSSPGMKPVNFDFSAASVEQDPKILHPVALRLSPESQTTYAGSSETEQRDASLNSNCIPTQPVESSSEAITVRVHSSSFSGTSDASKGLSASQQTLGLKKEPPPPPPPRPKHNHIRSSSLDLNKLGKTVPHFLGAPPAVPPRVSPSSATTPHKAPVHPDEQHNLNESIDFADFTNFEDADSANLHQKSGAFEVYKKPLTSQDRLIDNSSAGSETFLLEQVPTPSVPIDDSTALLVDISQQEDEPDRQRHPSAPPPLALTAASITSVPRDKRELQAAIKAHRERNMMLTLLNTELNQELSEIMEERIALEIQLEHLKPFS